MANGWLRIVQVDSFHETPFAYYKSWTAVERATYTTKSLIIALALVHGRLTAEQAALASQVEVASQIERWGEVEDCTSFTLFLI